MQQFSTALQLNVTPPKIPSYGLGHLQTHIHVHLYLFVFMYLFSYISRHIFMYIFILAHRRSERLTWSVRPSAARTSFVAPRTAAPNTAPGCARTERICSCIFTFRLAASTAAASAEWVWPTVTCISSFCEQTTCMLTKRWSFKDIENATIRIKQSVVVGGTQQTMSVCHTQWRRQGGASRGTGPGCKTLCPGCATAVELQWRWL